MIILTTFVTTTNESCANDISFTLLFSQVFLSNSFFVYFYMTSTQRTYTHQQFQGRIARNNHHLWHFTAQNSDVFEHAHSRRQHNNSHSVLSKYYSSPSWITDENASSDAVSLLQVYTLKIESQYNLLACYDKVQIM